MTDLRFYVVKNIIHVFIDSRIYFLVSYRIANEVVKSSGSTRDRVLF